MNYARAAGLARFLLVVIAVVMVCSIAICGIHFNDESQLKGIFEDDAVRLGLDLAGGSVVTFQAIPDEGETITSEGMQGVYDTMRRRLDDEGLTEALCYLVGDDMITIEIPDVDDPNEAIEKYMKTAVLTFRDSSGNIALTGKDHVENAVAKYFNDEKGVTQIGVELNLNEEGAKKFAAVTKLAAQNGTTVAIYMDDTLLSNPTVSSEYKDTGITGGTAMISGSFTEWEQAKDLANNINAGALKYKLTDVEKRTVGATLGNNSLSTSLIAGAIGVVLVIIFMCIYYKLAGVMASISLLAYMGLFGIVLVLTQANLTLAGIAGIVLSIGMSVDANVVIFERMKEDINMGKSAKAAVKGGFKRAFTAILDSNVTTVIACAVLYFLGSGSIKGFATTLFIGVIISLFTSLVLTRALLHLSVDMGFTNPNSYKSLGRRAK